MAFDSDDLSTIEAAIIEIATGGNERIKLGDREITRLPLEELRKLRDEALADINRAGAGGLRMRRRKLTYPGITDA